MKRLLITGAAGGIGAECRNRLGHLADILRVADRVDLGPARENEEVVQCDLADKAAVEAMVEGCDGIVHLGGQPVEATWQVVRDSNIEGVFNLYEAARKTGCTRILFASSNHAVGFHKQSDVLDATALTRPDSLYGVSKVFGEAMASMYHDKFGIETASVRIGSCFPEPTTHRFLSTWMSYADFARLVEAVFTVPRLGCPIIYGISNNDAKWWDNRLVSYIGWQPQDNAETFRAKVDAMAERPAPDAPDAVWQGGFFCTDGIHED